MFSKSFFSAPVAWVPKRFRDSACSVAKSAPLLANVRGRSRLGNGCVDSAWVTERERGERLRFPKTVRHPRSPAKGGTKYWSHPGPESGIIDALEPLLSLPGRPIVNPGIIVFAHGSRIEAANEAVRSTAAGLARAGCFQYVEAAFLELGEPDLEGAVAKLAAAGVERIIVVPYFLTLGIHLERDLPSLVQSISKSYNSLEITVTPPLDGHPALIQILQDRVRTAAG